MLYVDRAVCTVFRSTRSGPLMSGWQDLSDRLTVPTRNSQSVHQADQAITVAPNTPCPIHFPSSKLYKYQYLTNEYFNVGIIAM